MRLIESYSTLKPSYIQVDKVGLTHHIFAALCVCLFNSTLFAATVFSKKITCPIGGEVFETTLAGSGTQWGVHLDRKPWGPIHAPWPIAKCPSNGMIVFKDDFSEIELKKLATLISGDDYRAAKDSETHYFLLGKTKRYLGAPLEEVAWTQLIATWEADETQYPRYARNALSDFRDFLASSRSQDDKKKSQNFGQIAGELERRLGLFQEAERRFSILLREPDLEPTLREIIEQELKLVAVKDSAAAKFEPKKLK